MAITQPNPHDGTAFQLRDYLGGLLKRPTDLETQMKWVRAYIDLREDRVPEILEQIDDILSFFGAIHQLEEARREFTLEFLGALVRLCVEIEMVAKHALNVPRPIDLAPQVQPLIQTPDHRSYPSGHATEAAAIASALRVLSGDDLKTFPDSFEARTSVRIAQNRVVAGVHYPIDSAAGSALGRFPTAAVLHHLLGSGITLADHTFDPGDDDFLSVDTGMGMQGKIGSAITIGAPAIAWLFGRVRNEWP